MHQYGNTVAGILLTQTLEGNEKQFELAGVRVSGVAVAVKFYGNLL